jgi:hypothetical protein
MAARTATALTVLALLALLATSVSAQTTTFTDFTFLNADWTLTNETLNLGGTATASQVASGGDFGPYRQITNTLNSAAGFGFSNTLYGYHERAGAIFDPPTTGQISTIDYQDSSIRLAGGQQACGVALRQAGVIYYGAGFISPALVGVWTPAGTSGLTAANFDALAPGVQNPDFSVTAPAIQFGFYRANSTSVGGAGGATQGGIDNWTVTVHYDAATPTKSTSWGRLKALYASGR